MKESRLSLHTYGCIMEVNTPDWKKVMLHRKMQNLFSYLPIEYKYPKINRFPLKTNRENFHLQYQQKTIKHLQYRC